MAEKPLNPQFFRWLALAFAVLLGIIVLIADLGLGGKTLAFLYALPYGDKIGHFTLFGILSLLVSLGYPTERTRVWLLPILKSSLILLALITFEEITQIPLVNRNFSLLDLSADFAGVYLFGELGAYLRRIRV